MIGDPRHPYFRSNDVVLSQKEQPQGKLIPSRVVNTLKPFLREVAGEQTIDWDRVIQGTYNESDAQAVFDALCEREEIIKEISLKVATNNIKSRLNAFLQEYDEGERDFWSLFLGTHS